MKKIIVIAFILCSLVKGQSISQSVINAGGRTTTASINSQTVIYTDNIGEAVIGTANANGKMVTQGFLQPDFIAINNTTVTLFPSNATCGDKRDGFLRVDITNPPNNVAWYEYIWNPDTLCPNHDCQKVDSLTRGTFSVITVIHYYVGTVLKADTFRLAATLIDNNGPCNIKPFSGVSLSGSNNKFFIDNIEAYPDAKVCIYNRWGRELYCETGYDNVNKYWPRKGEKVTAGTYFYIIDAGDKGVTKSWLEVFD